jgi:hypothetical protein
MNYTIRTMQDIHNLRDKEGFDDNQIFYTIRDETEAFTIPDLLYLFDSAEPLTVVTDN